MLIDQRTLAGIEAGRIAVLYRRWDTPRAVVGGRQRTRIGELRVDAVDLVDPATLTDEDARAAGQPDLATLTRLLERRAGRHLYRVRVHLAGPDPRVALREDAELSAAEVAAIAARLDRLDGASPRGAWTRHYLQLIADHPARRAPDLAAAEGRETAPFKVDVRKLKELGLTESLAVGYRLSPRGAAFRAATT